MNNQDGNCSEEDTRKNTIDDLVLELTSLKNDYNILYEKNQKVIKEYEELDNKYATLVDNYKENTIIQSMNDMKKKYDSLIANTVPNYRYNMLNTKYEELVKVITSLEIFINHISKAVKNLEDTSTYDSNLVYKIQLELLILKEIIQDAI